MCALLAPYRIPIRVIDAKVVFSVLLFVYVCRRLVLIRRLIQQVA